MFGGFQSGWSAGLNQFTDLSERVQKLKTGLEAGLQDSGLLGPGDAPPNSEGLQSGERVSLPPQNHSSSVRATLVCSPREAFPAKTFTL